MNSTDQNVRTFRDFLEFYNLMSQTCFNHCVDSFKSRQLEHHEIDCVEKCAHKLIRFNNRSINVYADIQVKLMTKRQKEMEEKDIQNQAAAVAAAATSTVPQETNDIVDNQQN